jgi:hypothetical protein
MQNFSPAAFSKSQLEQRIVYQRVEDWVAPCTSRWLKGHRKLLRCETTDSVMPGKAQPCSLYMANVDK